MMQTMRLLRIVNLMTWTLMRSVQGISVLIFLLIGFYVKQCLIMILIRCCCNMLSCIFPRYDEKLDKILDEAYERFVAKKDGSTKQRKRAKEAYSDVLLAVRSFYANQLSYLLVLFINITHYDNTLALVLQ